MWEIEFESSALALITVRVPVRVEFPIQSSQMTTRIGKVVLKLKIAATTGVILQTSVEQMSSNGQTDFNQQATVCNLQKFKILCLSQFDKDATVDLIFLQKHLFSGGNPYPLLFSAKIHSPCYFQGKSILLVIIFRGNPFCLLFSAKIHSPCYFQGKSILLVIFRGNPFSLLFSREIHSPCYFQGKSILLVIFG